MNQPIIYQEPVTDLYDGYRDTQTEIYAIQVKKTTRTLFTIAAIIFASDFLALAMANATSIQNILVILVVPALITGMGFLAKKEALLAMIVGSLLVLCIWVYSIMIVGFQAALMGWLVKAILIYLIIAGFQQASEATKIKKELKL